MTDLKFDIEIGNKPIGRMFMYRTSDVNGVLYEGDVLDGVQLSALGIFEFNMSGHLPFTDVFVERLPSGEDSGMKIHVYQTGADPFEFKTQVVEPLPAGDIVSHETGDKAKASAKKRLLIVGI